METTSAIGHGFYAVASVILAASQELADDSSDAPSCPFIKVRRVNLASSDARVLFVRMIAAL